MMLSVICIHCAREIGGLYCFMCKGAILLLYLATFDLFVKPFFFCFQWPRKDIQQEDVN